MVKNAGFELNAMNYPLFSVEKSLNKEQKDFFREYGFLHFKNFIDKATVQLFIKESERIQQQWIKDDVKMVYGVPIKYGKDIDGSTIVQRFAFVNIYSDIFSDFLKDPRLESLFELIGADVDVMGAAAMPADYRVELVPAEYAPDGVFGRVSAWLTRIMER